MSSTQNPKQPVKPALEAALWLWETQKLELAQDPNRPRSTISSTRTAADRFGVPKSTVARQLAALKSGKSDYSTGIRVGRPSRLTEVEEKMLSFHTFMLRRDKRTVSLKVVQEATDALLSRRTPPGLPISHSWVRRWLRADRAQARQEAMLKGNATPSNVAPAEAEAENGHEDSDLDEDALSENETTDMNMYPSEHETSTLQFEPFGSPGEHLIDRAVEALANA
ncbi:hypothetical protein F4825DRAFT_349538 [Nemania diffusa]|nr:hypothetical protein F4825DRAFT_349538 [Nemania diffusa]